MELFQDEIAVILPTYNRGYIIGDAIRSVLSQTYVNFRLYIVDDGSNDNTADVVNAFSDQRIDYYCVKDNKGANYARNLALQRSCEDYITFLDSDNIWDCTFLERRMEILKKENVDLVFGRTRISDRNGVRIFPNNSISELSDRDSLIRLLCFGNAIDLNTVLLRKKTVSVIGGFAEDLKRFQDYELMLRCLLNGCSFYCDESILVTNRVQSDSISMSDELFWNARIQVFKKSIEYCRMKGLLYDVVYYLINNTDFKCDKNSEYRILSVLKPEDLMGLFQYIKQRDEYIKYLEDVQNKLKDIVSNKRWILDTSCIPNKKCLIIYGYGDVGKDIVDQINSIGKNEIVCIIDRKAVSESYQIVSSIENIEKQEEIDIIISIIDKNIADEIRQQLIDIGYQDDQIILAYEHLKKR